MPLKKYNTTSAIFSPSTNSYNDINMKQIVANPNSFSSSPKSGSSECSSPTENHTLLIKPSQLKRKCSISDQMTSLTNLIPSILEAAAATAKNQTSKTNLEDSPNANDVVLPTEIKSRLHTIFNQIEHEFNSLYAENIRLQQELIKNQKSKSSEYSKVNKAVELNITSSTSTLIPGQNKISLAKNILEKSNSQPAAESQNKIIADTKSNVSTNLTKSTTFSKTRINNLSFPKFKPNAREFIMQSIKNTSAQIVNKTQNSSSTFSSKIQYSLSGHKDGIWDINCLSIPTHLFNSNNNIESYVNNKNLLIGTASADTTARLWYLNSRSSNPSNKFLPLNNNLSPTTSTSTSTTQTNGFCIQQYCGHTGSVNSIRFHPKFFTHATNLILTASGDSEAHIWQCVLSPVNDSLESTSEVFLNYNNCYSFATNQVNNAYASNTHQFGLSSPSIAQHQQLQYTSTSSNLLYYGGNNNNYQDLIANAPLIRSPIKRFEGHTDACIAAEWFPDGELLATASWDRSANIYNVETGKILCTLQHDDLLTNVNIHSFQKVILTSSKDTTFKVWDFRDPICSVNVYQGHSRSVNSAIFVNEDKIATSSDDQTVKLWDLRIMRSPVCTINANSGVNRVCTMQSSPESGGETFLCLPLDNRDIKVYNLQGERILRMPRNNRIGHTRLITGLASCSNLLLSVSFDKVINCWSFDHNPPKSSSSINNLKFGFNNKENNLTHSETQQTNSTPTSQNGLIPNDQNYELSPTQGKIINYGSACLSPVPVLQSIDHLKNGQTSDSNNIGKGTNPLSKLAERIKI